MSAYRLVTLTCDVCGEIHDDGQSDRIRDARATARAEGWRYTRALGDMCPRHQGYDWYEGTGWVKRGVAR